ncbi:MAG: hypothetical protein ACK54Y_00210 [Bacteroidota bacterium]
MRIARPDLAGCIRQNREQRRPTNAVKLPENVIIRNRWSCAMSKDAKFLLLNYLIVFIALNLTVWISHLTIENKDLFAFSGILTGIAAIILPFLVENNYLLRRIANSQTKDKNNE